MITKFEEEKRNNPMYKEMKKQLELMQGDYQDMLVAREENKKQLEAKFQDIHRNIQGNFDFTDSEFKRVKDTLKAFNSKFTHNLTLLREEFEQKIGDFREYNHRRLKETTDRLDKIEDLIIKERDDRISETDTTVGIVKNNLDGVQAQFDNEQLTRIDREKEILQT